MLCTYQSLQFGDNQKRVPGYENDLMLSGRPNAPVKETLVDLQTDNCWDLVFSYASGKFYPAGAKVPVQDGGVIKSWYAQGGDRGGRPVSLVLEPFIIADGETGFVQAADFVDFSEFPTTDNSVNTDTIENSSVTAVVHSELCEHEKLEASTYSTNYSVIITTTSTRAVFDQIFVYAGACRPLVNTVTVSKGQSCSALAVFKKVTICSSEEIGTVRWPKISKWEQPGM